MNYPTVGICLHTFTTHPRENKPKALNFYGVFYGDYLIVTRDNKGDFYSIHVSKLHEYTPGDTYVTSNKDQPLPETTYAPAPEVCEQISAAHKAWKEYYKHHKTKKPKRKRW